MFERALRQKYRYDSHFGILATEDLWHLNLTNLQYVATQVNNELKAATEENFIEPEKNTKGQQTLNDKMTIIKHIIKVKLDEHNERENAAQKKAEKDALLEILHDKKADGLKTLSVEEIEAKIAAL